MGSIFVCGYCKKDYSDIPEEYGSMEKVILAGIANILCRGCRVLLEDEVAKIAQKYLRDGG